MKETDFNDLVKSIKQAGQIKLGKLEPSRKFELTIVAGAGVFHDNFILS